MKYSLFCLTLVAALLLSQIGEAEIAKGKGYAIARKAYQNYRHLGDTTSMISMTIEGRDGDKTVYNSQLNTLALENGAKKMLLTYEAPSNVAGTALLIASEKGGSSDIRFYLSARKRIKRIGACFKSVVFMGSLWTYEDLEDDGLEKFTYKWTGEDNTTGHPCHIVEFYPRDRQHSGYSRQIRWIDKDQHLTHKIEFYDQENTLIKTLFLNRHSQCQGKYWHAQQMKMLSHETGKSMQLVFFNHRCNTGLSAEDFSQAHMVSNGRSLKAKR